MAVVVMTSPQLFNNNNNTHNNVFMMNSTQQQQQQQQTSTSLRKGNRLSTSYDDLPLAAAVQQQQHFIGSYRLGRTLGTGSFGKVKLGTNVWTGEQVAIKSIPLARKDYRLEREIENLKSLDHPNIIKLHETVETSSKIHLVMEYVSGGELFDYIVQKRRLREDEARQFLREMISALDYTHGNLVAHRDLKLENVLLSEDGHIKIADFGFSAVIRPGNRFNSFCGSPMYSAPELFLGQDYLGPPVDIWALGAILYAMVCGFLPFGKWKDDMRLLVRKVCEGEFDIPNFVSRPCQRLILRMLRPSLEERISIEELRRDPWVNFDCPAPPRCFLPKRPTIPSASKVNMEVVSQLIALGFGADKSIVIEKLLAARGERTQITAVYYLLLERQERDLQELERQQQLALEQQQQQHQLKHLKPAKRRSSPPCPIPAPSVFFKLDTISEVEEDSPPTLSNFFSSSSRTTSSSSTSGPNSPLTSPRRSPSPSPPRSRGDSWAPPRKGSANSGPPSPSAFTFRLRGKSMRQTPKDLPLSSSSSSSSSISPPHPQGGSYLSTMNRTAKISSASPKLYSSCGSEMITPPTLVSAATCTSALVPPSVSPSTSPPPPSSSSPSSSALHSQSPLVSKRSRKFGFSAFSLISSSSGGVKVLSEDLAGMGGNSSGTGSGFGLRSCKASMFNVDTSSSKSPEAIASLLRKALDYKQVRYKIRSNGFEFKCKVSRNTSTSRPSSTTTSPSTSTTSMGILTPPLEGEEKKGLLGGGMTSGTSGTGTGSFVIQVCRIDKLNLYGVRCSRFTGDRWLMRDFCADILTSLNL